MGTKNNPGRFDCYAAAKPDEPMFVLLARDKMSGFLVSIWARVRAGDTEAANAVFMKMLHEVAPRYVQEPDVEKSNEAIECALAMFEWHKHNRPSIHEPPQLGNYGLNNEGLPDISQGLHIFADGNAWCAVGPTFIDLQASAAGFGYTHQEAIDDWWRCNKDSFKGPKPTLAEFAIHQPTVLPHV